MTTKELQIKLLAYYRENLAALPEDFLSGLKFCEEKHIHLGICKTLDRVFGFKTESNKWITERHVHPLVPYWGKPPCQAYTTQEIKQALQLRIDILEKIVAENT